MPACRKGDIVKRNSYIMKRKKLPTAIKFLPLVLLIGAIIGLLWWYLSRTNIPVLEPAGQIAQKEKQLIIIGLLLSVIVVVPVYTLTILFIVKYREGNKKATYRPDWDHSRILESLWWAIPIAIISVLSVITWNSAHALDPYKRIASKNPTMVVDVVALDWKWLFIYPDQHIATVSMAEIPVNTPVDFNITSDTVMNSFWVPQLGGQIYAMPGMMTQLNLEADKIGSYNGVSANISGSGFASMTFTTKSVSAADYAAWLKTVKNSPNKLTATTYSQLSKPTDGYPVTYYSSAQAGLYNDIIMKYMAPGGGMSGGTMSMQGMAE